MEARSQVASKKAGLGLKDESVRFCWSFDFGTRDHSIFGATGLPVFRQMPSISISISDRNSVFALHCG
jgi:hypothetical protein